MRGMRHFLEAVVTSPSPPGIVATTLQEPSETDPGRIFLLLFVFLHPAGILLELASPAAILRRNPFRLFLLLVSELPPR